MSGARALPPRHKTLWTAQDEQVLAWGWGVFSIDTLCKRLGRTPAAILNRVRVLDLGPPGRGYMTARAVAAEAGCDPTTVVVVAGYLGIKLKRRPSTKYKGNGVRYRRGNVYSIDQEDAERIIEEICRHSGRVDCTATGEWDTGRKACACLDCGRTDRPHCARNLCTACWKRHQKAGTLAQFPPLTRRGERKGECHE